MAILSGTKAAGAQSMLTAFSRNVKRNRRCQHDRLPPHHHRPSNGHLLCSATLFGRQEVTTEAAARLYEAQHLLQWAGRPLAIFNPSNRPVDELPTIYGFNNGGGGGLYHAVLIAEDGTFLGSHGCSSECYMPADLGCLEGSRPDRHETFKEHYPDGYRMSFVPHSQIAGHEKLNAAFEFIRKMAEAAEATA